jgi:hypothetical protein
VKEDALIPDISLVVWDLVLRKEPDKLLVK